MVIKERTFRNEYGKEAIIQICSSKSGSYLIAFETEKVMYKLTV